MDLQKQKSSFIDRLFVRFKKTHQQKGIPTYKFVKLKKTNHNLEKYA